jgi:hypothetical protein
MDRKKMIFGIALMLFCMNAAAAINVGFVIQYPDGSVDRGCLNPPEDENGYMVLESTGINLTWHDSGAALGHGLCAIDGVGCPQENCWCTDKYWGFYIRRAGETDWTYSAVGFDGGNSCNEHYCAKEGDAVGFAYGTFGTKPLSFSFSDVCRGKVATAPQATGMATSVYGYAGVSLLIILAAALYLRR